MAQLATTKEQSKILLEAGLDRRTSDMWYSEKDGLQFGYGYLRSPAWTFQALLDVMPKEICGVRIKYRLRIQYEREYPMMYYVVTEGEYKGRLLRFGNRCTPDAKDLIDAAVQLICWMLRDGIIKKV